MENVRLLEYLASDEWKRLLNASLLESLCKKQAQRKLNLELPPQGGKFFWETLTVEGWKIQRNKIDGHCRILKPDNTRCAYGSELEIKSLFENYLSEQKQRESTTRKKYGIVFAGGGAKGAFQIGVWKYLREQGLDRLIDGVSGSSVGALNSLLFLNGNFEVAEKLWGEIDQWKMTPPNLDGIIKIWKNLAIMPPLVSIPTSIVPTFLSVPLAVPVMAGFSIKKALFHDADQGSGSKGLSAQSELEKLIDEKICWERIEKSDKVAYCSLSVKSLPHKPEPSSGNPVIGFLRSQSRREYICWKGKSRNDIKNLVLASASLPILYGLRDVNGHECLDGGIQDNVPISPLARLGFSEIIVIHLQQKEHEKSLEFDFSRRELERKGVHIYDVYPGKDFDDSFGATISISPEKSKIRMAQGYSEAATQLATLSW